MKWKRCRSRLSCEEEEEEDLDRRSSLRKKQRVSYIQDVYDDDDDEEEEEEDGAYEEKEDEEEEDQEDNEQPGTSTHNHKAQENGLWPVTCGSKKGILHVEKLASDKACIKSDSGWFGLRAFEIFGGKASSKKWKTSIYYKKKPLQFWIEQGALTINNYKRRETATIKKRKSSSPICKSESTSEELELQSADETEEDDVEEEWLSSSGKLAPETQEGEEERVGAENGDFEDSGDDNWNEKEEMGEKEDEDMPASKEREAKMIISASDIVSAIAKKKVRVAIKRLPEFQATRDCKSDSMEHPQEDSWCKPLDEDASSEYSHSSTDDDQMSEPSIFRGVEEENGEESTQNNERKEYGQREIKTETPPSSPVATTPDIKPEILDKTENFRLNSIHTADLNTSSAVTDTLSIQGVFKEETIEGMSELAEYGNTDAMTSDHDAAHLQVMAPETRVPQDSDSAQGPVSTYSNLDTMDLDQLKREKIKMQLKVLKLQDEYYSLKIEKLKKK